MCEFLQLPRPTRMTMSCCCFGTLENVEVAAGDTSGNGFVYYDECLVCLL